jgi:hypothetical protein
MVPTRRRAPPGCRTSVCRSYEERPHQGLGNRCIAPATVLIGSGPVRCRERLGGVLKLYYRPAASRRGPSCRTRPDLETLHPMRLQPGRSPDSPDHRLTDTSRLGHQPRVPMRLTERRRLRIPVINSGLWKEPYTGPLALRICYGGPDEFSQQDDGNVNTAGQPTRVCRKALVSAWQPCNE